MYISWIRDRLVMEFPLIQHKAEYILCHFNTFSHILSIRKCFLNIRKKTENWCVSQSYFPEILAAQTDVVWNPEIPGFIQHHDRKV